MSQVPRLPITFSPGRTVKHTSSPCTETRRRKKRGWTVRSDDIAGCSGTLPGPARIGLARLNVLAKPTTRRAETAMSRCEHATECRPTCPLTWRFRGALSLLSTRRLEAREWRRLRSRLAYSLTRELAQDDRPGSQRHHAIVGM